MVDGEKYGREEDDGCPYSWLNEWLCEYVDGTMDPSVRVTFEEYLEANPELAEHVECLRRTRELLCGQNKNEVQVPRELRERLCQQTESEMMQEHRPLAGMLLTSRVGTAAAVGSTMAVMLLVGMFVGATLFADTTHREGVPATAVAPPAAESAEVPPAPETEAAEVQRRSTADRPAIPPHRPFRTQPYPAAVTEGSTPLQALIPSYLDESGAALPVMTDTIIDHGLRLSTRQQP